MSAELQHYSQSRRMACHRTEWPLEVVPAGSSHWHPMDTFLFHRSYTRQTSVTAVNREADGFVNSAVRYTSNGTVPSICVLHYQWHIVSLTGFIPSTVLRVIQSNQKCPVDYVLHVFKNRSFIEIFRSTFADTLKLISNAWCKKIINRYQFPPRSLTLKL